MTQILARGIDIAFNYQILTDAQSLKNAGIRFVIHKATEGTDYHDARLQSDLAALRAVGIDVASYAFDHPAQSAPAQVAYFHTWAGNLAVAVDEEITQGLSWPAVASETQAELSAFGSASMLYSNLNFLGNMPGSPWGHLLWLAEPGVSAPTRPCVCWQYGIGNVSGIQGQCDLDAWVGTQADYDSFFHPTAAQGGHMLNAPVVGGDVTSDGAGYFMAGRDGGVFTYGDAQFHGSTGNIKLNQPVVGMAATPSGHGYWLVAADGGVFAFGDAGFHGSAAGQPLNGPVVGITRTPTGNGYYLWCADGGVRTFGDAVYHGSVVG